MGHRPTRRPHQAVHQRPLASARHGTRNTATGTTSALWERSLAGSQYQHRDRSRNPTLVGLVLVAEVRVDDLP